MHDFGYRRPKELAQAIAMLSEIENSQLLAGGMTLIPTLKQRLAQPSVLIDLSQIDELQTYSITDNMLTIGSMCTHYSVNTSSDIRDTIPALANLAGKIGDRQVRYCGTIGGSIANSDPAADYPAAVIALNSKINTNKRVIPADDFFRGLFETALDPDEIIVSISFEIPQKATYIKIANIASGYAMCGMFLAKFAEQNYRCGITGAGHYAFRHHNFERMLADNSVSGNFREALLPKMEFNDDLYGSSAYRENLVRVLCERSAMSLQSN